MTPSEIRRYQLQSKDIGAREMEKAGRRANQAIREAQERVAAGTPIYSEREMKNLPRRFSMKSRSFSWGVKPSGYEYEDYEFEFDALDKSQVEAYMEAITRMSSRGWEMDMSRSDQEVTGWGDYQKAVTRHEIRFRRPTR